MDAAALLATFRHDASDDVGTTKLWTDARFYASLTEAESEAAVRAKLLRDHRSGFCRITLVVGQTEYRIDPRIFLIDRARLQWPDAASTCFDPVTVGATAEQANERTRTGRPCALYHLDGQRRIVLDRAPTAAGVLHLEVYRRPLYAIEDGSDEPEIPEQFHEALLHWVKYRAYGKRDALAADDPRSAQGRDEFERVFGPPVTAYRQRARSERRAVVTRPETWP